jgi:hypothetical protein
MDVSTLVSWYDQAEWASVEARQLSERDRDYYDNDQLTAEEIAVLRARGQPPLVFNRIAPKIDTVIGTEIKMRTDPKAYPRTPREDTAAESATDAMRFVCDDNGWPYEKSQAYRNMCIEGTGGAEVRVERRPNGKIRIIIEHVPWDRSFWDPRSRYEDFRDAKYFGTVLWMDLEDALAKPEWQDKQEELEAAINDSGSMDDTYDDRPRYGVWVDTDHGRKRVKICQIQWKQGRDWYVATFTRGAFIEEPRKSPYVNEHGESIPCLVLQSAKINRKNERYGIVRALIGPQDEVNKRRSKALHAMSTRQVVAERGAVDDVAKAQQQVARPDGYIEVMPGRKFEIQPNTDMSVAHVQLYQDAKNEIDNIGANAALAGKDTGVESGRAIMARQQSGLTELQIIFDNLRWFSLRVYRQVWYAIRQFWQDETWIRVRDSDEHMRWVALNRRVTLGEWLQSQGIDPMQYVAMKWQRMMPANVIPMPGMQPMAPDPSIVQAMLSEVVDVENTTAELDVDVVIEEAPDTVVLQQEQYEALTDLVRAGMQIPPEALIEASALRNKKRVLELMKGGGASPQEQQQAQAMQQKAMAMQEAAAQLELQQKAADVEQTQAETVKIKADTAATVTGAKVEIDRAARESANQAVERAMPMQQPMMGGGRRR